MAEDLLALPPEIDTHRDIEEVIQELYGIFCRDFVDHSLLHDGLRVEFDRRIMNEGKIEFFWHLTHFAYQSGKGRNDAVFDHGRSKRLPWIRPIVESDTRPEIVRFDYREGSGVFRRYLWLRRRKIVVILQRIETKFLPDTFRLITAFCVDFSRKEKELTDKYNRRL